MLETAGASVAVMTGIQTRIGTKDVPPCSHVDDLGRFVARCNRERVEFLVCEIGSYALSRNLHQALNVSIAVLTNVGYEHLNRHRSFRNYRFVKARLIRDLHRSSHSPWAVLHRDDEWFDFFSAQVPHLAKIATFGCPRPRLGPTDLSFQILRESWAGTQINMAGFGCRPTECWSPTVGSFNVKNVGAAAAATLAAGIPYGVVTHAITQLRAPPGRFEISRHRLKNGTTIVVDYAHTAESVREVISSARALDPNARLVVLLGCGGRTYRAKRKRMAAAASQIADQVVITSDLSRGESPAAIAREMLAGIPQSFRTRCTVTLDRATAIHSALRESQPRDSILLLGMGNTPGTWVDDEQRFYTDIELIRMFHAGSPV